MAEAPTPRSGPGTCTDVRAFVRERFGVRADRIRRLSSSDTTVWRIDAPDGAFVLRRHGTHTDAEIASVMMWLDALARTDVRAPRPLRSTRGAWTVDRCTLVTWVRGRAVRRAPRPVHHERLGRTLAQLHRHVATWAPPPGFVRPAWTAADVFCERGVARPPGGDPWALVPARIRPVFREAAERARPALDAPRRILVHADLHHGNAVFADGHACPIDFDDCGFAVLGYDVASTLGGQRLRPAWPAIRDAFLRGYASVTPPPDLTQLDELILGRRVGLALWAASLAETVPHFREPLPGWLAHFERELRQLL